MSESDELMGATPDDSQARDERGERTEERYRKRISFDMEKSLSIFQTKLGVRPTVFTWPYSAYNIPAIEEGKKLGFRMFLTLDEGLADTHRLDTVNRYYAQNLRNGVPSFNELKQGPVDTTSIRAR